MAFGTLAGKGVVITGAAAGIGRATALYLAGEGVRVVADIDADGGKSVVEEVRAAGGAAEFVACGTRPSRRSRL
jgi:NAD(P)-dependent dehydrogenase (short-subunit alcohol dehydrogenase family)